MKKLILVYEKAHFREVYPNI